MKKFTHWVVKKLIKDNRNTGDRQVRYYYGMLEGWVSIIGNILLCILKLVAGYMVNSAALIADAIHTLSDSLSSGVVIFGFAMARKPSDREHPFGHGRMESVAALIISILLFVAGFELLQFSIKRLLHPSVSGANLYVIALVLSTILAKELMARFSYELGDIIDSKALKADALHHRSDALTTLLVVIALVGSYFGYHSLDGIMGVIVSVVIGYSAFIIAKEAISPLLGEAPSRELINEIESIVLQKDGITGVHDIICHFYGNVRIISLHIEVSPEESVLELHNLAEDVEREIERQTKSMVIVHIDPINKNHPQYEDIYKTISDIIERDKRIHSFHDMRIVGDHLKGKVSVLFDVVLEQGVDETMGADIIKTIKGAMTKEYPLLKVAIKIDPMYSYNP